MGENVVTVLMFQKRFVAPIKSGIKRHTIRPKRKRPIKPDEALSLRHWEDKAYRSPQIEFGTGVALGSLDIRIFASGIKLGSDGHFDGRYVIDDLDDFAVSDGFENWQQMKEFFESRFGYGLPFEGDFIQWEDAEKS